MFKYVNLVYCAVLQNSDSKDAMPLSSIPPEFIYGPFWRFETNPATAFEIKRSGKLRGAAATKTHASYVPAVRAYGKPSQIKGNMFFYTKVPPDESGTTAFLYWREKGYILQNGGPSLQVRPTDQVIKIVDSSWNELVEIDVFVYDITCDRRKTDLGPPSGKADRRLEIS